jgi:hypothetical protein
MPSTERQTGRPPRLKPPMTPAPAGNITRAAFARWLGCPQPRITEWVREGVLTLTPEGLIDPRLAVERLRAGGRFAAENQPEQVADPAAAVAAVVASADNPTARQPTYDEAVTAKEILKAHQALLDLRARRGELIEVEKAGAIAFAAGRAFRDGLQNLPPRIAAEMASKLGVDPGVLLGELNDAIRLFLTEVAEPSADWRQGL